MPPRARSRVRLPALPALLEQKLTKAGYTRGATTAEIFQNRVTRNNTVLIDLEFWDQCRDPADGTEQYENGFIVLIQPGWYFTTPGADDLLSGVGLVLGQNALLLFRRKSEWLSWAQRRTTLPNGMPFEPAQSRKAPLGGTYIARVHATVADDGGSQVFAGYDTTSMRGAGIRVYEYASTATIAATRLQLEAIIWHCEDAEDTVTAAGMSPLDIAIRRTAIFSTAADAGLLDQSRLEAVRILDDAGRTVCPLCLKALSAADFMRRGEQAAGRETYDITITELGLFHIQELRVGRLQHKPYNLGWGHHYCNVVVKDAGIVKTLEWMEDVLLNQHQLGRGDLGHEAESVEEAVDR